MNDFFKNSVNTTLEKGKTEKYYRRRSEAVEDLLGSLGVTTKNLLQEPPGARRRIVCESLQLVLLEKEILEGELEGIQGFISK